MKEEIRSATLSLSAMIQDSDLVVQTMGYGKAVPKSFKLSPDGWFQVRRRKREREREYQKERKEGGRKDGSSEAL